MLTDWFGWEMEMREYVGEDIVDLLCDSLRDNTIGPGWFS